MPAEIVGRESGFVYFKEGDEVRVNDDAVLAPDTIRGEVGTVKKVNRFLTTPAQVSESTIAVDRYQQLVKQPRETQILGLALQVFFPKILRSRSPARRALPFIIVHSRKIRWSLFRLM